MRRAGSTGMKTPAHVIGHSSSTSALLARCSIEVCDDSSMIRASASANYVAISDEALHLMRGSVPLEVQRYSVWTDT